MKIGEVAKLTGLTVSNIRFYEKKGLLEPAREQESDYRNYSKADVRQLKKIIFYRKMNISVENISLLLQGKVSLKAVVENTLNNLYAQKEALQGSIELCEKVLTEKEMDSLDIDEYLSYVREEEERGTRYAQMEEFLEELTDYTKTNRLRGDPYVGRFFKNRWVARILAVLLLLLMFFAPAIWIAEKIAAGEMISYKGLVIWGILWFMLIICFVCDRKWRKH